MAVVVWHWNWLYFDPGTSQIILPPADQMPLRHFFYLLHKMGYLAVDLFFGISGFVFFHMYGERLAGGQITPQEFWWNRFTRLYPLHLVTLLFVAALQPIYHATHGVYFIYQYNQLPQFGAQLLMASNWWPGAPYSFNGPIWSVSVEILLYASFLMLARRGLARPWCAVALALSGSFLIAHVPQIGRGFMSFYIGALCYFTFKDRREFRMLVFAIIGAGIIQVLHRGLSTRDAAVVLLGIPTLIMLVLLNEQRLKFATSKLGWLGDISYSSYLLHFPVMLFLVSFGVALNPQSGVHLLVYLTGIILLSLMCFRYFERPTQIWLRGIGARTSREKAFSELSAESGAHHSSTSDAQPQTASSPA